jgi:hypothetical protein
MAVNFTTLFTRLGKMAHASVTLNTAAEATVPAEVLDVTDEFAAASLDLQDCVSNLPQAVENWKSTSRSLFTALKQSATGTLKTMIEADNPQEQTDLTTYLEELILQMQTANEDVDSNTVGATATAGGSNAGDGKLVLSTKRGDGLINENMLAEDMVCSITTANGAAASLRVQGEAAVSKAASNWPQGSGANRSLSAITVASNLLTNSGFETEEDIANAPDGWIVAVGTIGTTLKLTDVEVQQIVVTGSPSAGWYTISWTNPDSKVLTTTPLAYNATSSEVQAALRALEGLEQITVAESGTTPNYTHTITFTGVGGNLSQVTVTNGTTGGTLTPGTTTTGSTHVYSGGKALEFDSDGSQLTAIWQRLTNLKSQTSYAFNGWFKTDSVPAAGVLTVDLYDGSAVINDDEGTANSFTIAATGLTTSYVASNGVFRLPRVVPPVIYLRIRISTGVSNTSSVFIDHCALGEARELYDGGPVAALFAGADHFAVGDTFTIAVTNDRAGSFQEWFERWFDMRAKGLLLPSDGTGSIADSLIG